jgi:hypothetical protein
VRARLIALGALLATLASAGAAHASATLTYPPDGATVSLDKNAHFTFTWTVPDGETMPDVYIGDTPTYDPDTLAPFNGECGSTQTPTSCATDSPIPAGRHYAFMFTTDTDNTQHFFSPVTSFIVPPKLGLGCGPLGGCVEPKGFRKTYVPHPPIGIPYSTLEMGAWFNAPDDSVATFSFTIKRGHKVLGRVHDVEHSNDLGVDSGFTLTHARILSGSHHIRWHAPRAGTPVTSISTVSAEGLSITRSVKVKTPPA